MFTLRLRKILLYSLTYYLLLIIAIIYFILFLIFQKTNSNIKDNYFELTLKNYKISDSKISFIFNNNMIGNYYLKNNYELNNFISNISLNDKLKIYGQLNIPNNNTIPNNFNYKNYLKHKNINSIINIEKYEIISKNNNIFYKIKNYIYLRINNIKYNIYLYAFILGDSSHIDKSIYNNYKINGITHLFALSGLHVSMFSNILLFILKKIRINENISFILTSIFLIFFSFIASFTPSILRATIMFILSNINKIYYLYIKPKYLLYLTFTILIFINPNYIFNTGFILSFTITFFIILYIENNHKSSIFRISFLSLLSSLPIIINLSYEVNVIGFINNLFFIPYVTYMVFPLSLLTIIISKLDYVLNILIKMMEYVSSLSSQFIYIPIYVQKMNIIEIIIYYLLLILIIKNRKYIIKYFIIFLFIIYIKPFLNKTNYIYFLDVGQGDSSLVLTKNNKSIVIDTGGLFSDYNVMINEIIPFYKSIGIKKINYLLLTHGDFDHMGEAINLVNNFKVEKVIFNCGEFNELEKELIKVLDKKKIKYYSCIKELSIDNNKLYFLQTGEYDNENDNSNVIYTELNGYKFMFMGDAGVEKEKDILDKYNINNIDVLKVGHHGSKTSSGKEFINEINPKYSIISVGKNNRYGHPNKEVLRNLDKSKIYRTDQDGSIMFRIKNDKLNIEICSP